MSPERSLEARFWSKVDQSGECWLWTASIGSHGYGQIYADRNGKKSCVLAHRVSYEFTYGVIPEGLQIDHLCRVRRCVRPDHLEAVTQAENIARSDAPAAIVQRTNRCIRDHEVTDETTYRNKHGWRICRECARVRWQKYAPRQREAAAARSRAWYWANKEKRSA